MGMSREHKLIIIGKCIEDTCNSSVRLFDLSKGHSSRSVGFAAYEERQHRLKEIAEELPDVIEFLCKRGGHNYFKFEGQTIKIISSPRENLSRNVFEKNTFEKSDVFENFDPLLRIIYSADYDLESNEVTILECHYLEINRQSEKVINEINILSLAKDMGGYIAAITTDQEEAKELSAAGLQFAQQGDALKQDDLD